MTRLRLLAPLGCFLFCSGAFAGGAASFTYTGSPLSGGTIFVTFTDIQSAFDYVIQVENSSSKTVNPTITVNSGTNSPCYIMGFSITNSLSTLSIKNNTGSPFVLKPMGNVRFLTKNTGALNLTLKDMTIDGFHNLSGSGVPLEDNLSGRAVFVPDSLILNTQGTTNFTDNRSDVNGGALQSNGVVTVNNNGNGSLTFSNNSALAGGALQSKGAVTIDNTSTGTLTFSNNYALAGGGAFLSEDAVTVNNNANGSLTFSENKSAIGGALYSIGGLTINNSGTLNFSGNSASISGGTGGNLGGALYSNGGLTINNSGTLTFSNNYAINHGGAIYSYGDVNLTDTQFVNNYTTREGGGAIYMAGVGSTLTYTTNAKTTLNPGSGNPSGDTIGNNDIACIDGTVKFTKEGSADLVINTQNPGWVGSTTVNAGRMIVGGTSANTTSSWGSAAGSDVIVGDGTNPAALGGFGTIYGHHITFPSGSTWVVGITPTLKTKSGPNDPDEYVSGQLIANGTLYLASSTSLQLNPSGIFTAGTTYTYTIAKFRATNSNNIPNYLQNVTVDPTDGGQGLVEVSSVNYGPTGITVTVNPTSTLPSDNPFSLNDTVIDTTMQNSDSGTPELMQDDFVSKFSLASLQPMKDRQQSVLSLLTQSKPDPMATLLHAVASKGRMVVNWNQYRLWVSPYYARGTTQAYQGQSAVHDHHEGILIGAEKRSLSRNWTVGILTGVGMGNAAFPQTADTNIRDKSMFFGLYHSLGFLEHARYDIILNSTFTDNQGQRSGKLNSNTSYLALANYKSRTLSANFETSYQFKLKKHSSFRPNLGFTFAEHKRSRYTERNAGLNARTFGEQRDITKEVYAGIGLRHSWKAKQYDIKLTGVLEHGYEMANDNTQQTIYTINGPKGGFKTTQAGPGRHTNYVTTYVSALNNNTKLKCMAGYTGSFQKHRTVHAFTLKAELRF